MKPDGGLAAVWSLLSLAPVAWGSLWPRWPFPIGQDCCCSVTVSCLTLRPQGLQRARPPCPSPSPGVCSNLCPCHPTISSSVVPFSSRLQSFPASGSFPMSHLFTSGGQGIGALASASVLPVNIQGWFPLGWTGLISLQSKGLSRVFANTTVQKHQFFGAQPFLWSNSHIHILTTGKIIAWLYRPLLAKWCFCCLIRCLVCHSFSPREQASFNFLAAVTKCSDFWCPIK